MLSPQINCKKTQTKPHDTLLGSGSPTLPNLVLLYPTLPYPTLPYVTLPYLKLRYPTLLNLATPRVFPTKG